MGENYNGKHYSTFLALEKHLSRQIAKAETKGVILNKGEADEFRATFQQMLSFTQMLRSYFESQGVFSMGACCLCCQGFDPKYSSRYIGYKDPTYGLCEGKDHVHCFYLCSRFKKREGEPW